MTDDMAISLEQVVLEMVPLTVPANRAFTPEELERRIQMHAERAARHAERKKPKAVATPATSYEARSTPKNIRLVNCARCERSLLGESQEPLRLTKYRRHRLPPPVAARLHGNRPYCGGCAAVYA